VSPASGTGCCTSRSSRILPELDVHVAEVEASVQVLKALLASDEALGEEDPGDPDAI
jgi:hypothetical protein